MKLLNKTEEKMVGRTEVVYSLEKKATTPSRLELQKEIAKKEKAKAELVVVKNIDVAYGSNTFTVTALIYEDAASYKVNVPKYLAKKSVIPEDKPAEPKEEAAPAPAPAAEEAPKEEAAPAEEETKEAA